MIYANGNGSAKNTPGLIFNIQRFSIHDGPGIRTTVFMKGCPLRCLWCSNPESQAVFPNLMIREINCRGCGACQAACSKGALGQNPAAAGGDGGSLTVLDLDWERCDQCLQCVDSCIYGALQTCGEYVTLDKVLDEVLRDRPFYKESGGGLTVSGGEPLMQADFTARLLQGCREAGLHTALDTSGYASWDTFEKVLPFLDLVLFDVKHLDPAEHQRGTGVDNALILENLSRLSRLVPAVSVWIRVPLVPGYNDAEKHIKGIVNLAQSCGIEKISLLPYHEGGKSKSDQLGKKYRLKDILPPEEGHVHRLVEIIRTAGLQGSVGS